MKTWECRECSGEGAIRTGGCSLEHGITTSCEEYGCLPPGKRSCSVCSGRGVLDAPPNLRKLAAYSVRLGRGPSPPGEHEGDDVHLQIYEDEESDAFVVRVEATPGPTIPELRLEPAGTTSFEGRAPVQYRGAEMTARAWMNGHPHMEAVAPSRRHDLRVSINDPTGEELWSCGVELRGY
jgi:hypothetical protein